MSCSPLTASLSLSCAASQKVSGVAKAVYFGHVSEITTCTFATDGDIATFALTASKYLYKYESKHEKITGTYNVVAGDNVNLFEQSIQIPLYHATQAEKAKIQALCKADDLFCIIQELSGKLVVYGINNTTTGDFDEYGLKTTAGEGGTGTAINDPNAYTVTLTRILPNMPMDYKPGTALATNIAALDAMLV